MINHYRRLLFVIALTALACFVVGIYLKAAEKTSTNLVCDTGLSAWTNSQFGKWVFDSTRIVKTDKGFQPQFRDCKSTNAVWIAMFEGEKAWSNVSLAKYHLRRAFEARVEAMDATEMALDYVIKALPATNAPPGVSASTNLYVIAVGDPPIAVFTNCISAELHEPNCYLIRWLDKSQTNDFHAWMVPIKIEKQKLKM